MAIHAPITPGADGANSIFPVLSRLDRAGLAWVIDAAIGMLDAADGDPDEEADGDELDGCWSEEDFMNHGEGHGPGCVYSDSDFDLEDVAQAL